MGSLGFIVATYNRITGERNSPELPLQASVLSRFCADHGFSPLLARLIKEFDDEHLKIRAEELNKKVKPKHAKAHTPAS